MADTFSPEERSQIMRKVKSKGNLSTELGLIKVFNDNKNKGWRRNYKLYGNPDFVFPKYRLVVFADGCFWHGHNCRSTKPSSNVEYWNNKLEKNKKRDRIVTEILKDKKWHVIRFWECEITGSDFSEKLEIIKKILMRNI